MSRTLITWGVVATVVGLLLVAGVDALLSSGSEKAASAPTASIGITDKAKLPPRRCTRLDIRVLVEIRGGVATAVVRNVGLSPCHLRALRLS
jgi:hypothetical protein